jgi:putative ABC transport system permease protein
MLKNYIKLAIRNLLLHKGYSFINIAGLAIGMACCLLIFGYVRDEFNYDRYHEKADQIYRVVGNMDSPYNETETAAVGPPLAPALRDEFPAILNVARIAPASLRKDKVLVSYREISFYEKRLGYADSSLFKIFSLPLAKGDPQAVLNQPHSIVISESMAKKYFGAEEPVGKVLAIENKFDYEITGVMKDMPRRSHFRFDFIAAFASLKDEYHSMMTDCWRCPLAYTYVLLPKDLPSATLEKHFPQFWEQYNGGQGSPGIHLRLQPLTDIHLNTGLTTEIEPAGNPALLYVLMIVGCCILFIACINYVNLATARSSHRAKEVGMRKVVGAKREQLVGQFLSEATLLALLALPMALVLIEIFSPFINDLAGKDLRIESMENWRTLLGLTVVALLVGGLSGSYPAWYLSRLRPALILKGRFNLNVKAATMRRILVITQFALAVILVVATITMFAQLHYLRSKRLGFDKEQVVVVPLNDAQIREQNASPLGALRAALLQNPKVLKVSAAENVPPANLADLELWPDTMQSQNPPRMKIVTVDYEFFQTLGIEVMEGRTDSPHLAPEAKTAFVLNETAVKALGWESAVGKKIRLGERWHKVQGEVVGVVKDFHFGSLHQRIEPTVFDLGSWFDFLLVRISPDDVSGTLAFLQEKWEKFWPHRPFEFFFLDKQFKALYETEERLGKLFVYFAGLTIVIAGLGLYGLASFMAAQRTKEIGIRKVLGASVAGIVSLLAGDFLKLVALANIIAWPIAWYAMNRWLQNFAYRIDIGWWMFALAGGLALLIAFMTVSTQAIKAALANPVEALRYE